MKKISFFAKHKKTIFIGLASIFVLTLYYTKLTKQFQVKKDQVVAFHRIVEKIDYIEKQDMNPIVQGCVVALYNKTKKQIEKDDESYKDTEDKADLIYAAYLFGLDDGWRIWKKKKTLI